MLLENKFYRVLSKERESELSARFHLAILPECDVYDGHFPNEPVCPGVCNIETIKECCMLLCGESLRYSAIKQCRLTALATPPATATLFLPVSRMAATSLGTRVSETAAQKEAHRLSISNVSPTCSAWWIRFRVAVLRPEKLKSSGLPSIFGFGSIYRFHQKGLENSCT